MCYNKLIKMKINTSKLVNMIQESIKRHILNESTAYAYELYSPSYRDVLSDEEYESLSPELLKLYNKSYKITFSGDTWYSPGSGEWMYSLGEPADGGIQDIDVADDGGLSNDIEIINKVNPLVAQKIKEDFENWCVGQDESSLEFEDEGSDYPEYDDNF